MRIAVLSDVHANLPALEAVLAALGPVDAIWHLGDIVGYGPHPDEVVDRLRQLGAVGVRGNHDAAALDLERAEWFNPDARRAIEWTAGHITPATRGWLARLPERLEIDGITLVHGSPRDPTWEYITTPSGARANLGAFGTSHLLFGHTHLGGAFRDKDGRMEAIEALDGATLVLDSRRVLANPGSVGQPRDGDSRASAAILDTSSSTLTWHRVAYPIAATQADIRARGLPGWLADRLAGGR
jgi:diadenosine tetraphosphatase ApaH/serine/threonine PP2A family protein phosphatase